MKKTPGATKAIGMYGYCKHLRPYGKRLANRAVRRNTKVNLKKDADQ
jgi:hypothetical protein